MERSKQPLIKTAFSVGLKADANRPQRRAEDGEKSRVTTSFWRSLTEAPLLTHYLWLAAVSQLGETR